MLSILIPTYNYNVTKLVNDIHKQLIDSNVDFEIICIDDGSSSKTNLENEKVNSLKNSKFIAELNNIGLSNNRNHLASLSQYDYLLFLDGDSLIIGNSFIKSYLENIYSNTDILYGGRVHPEFVENQNQKLRWKYGKNIEDKSANRRNKDKHKTLMFNNTLIRKKCFNSILFDSNLIKYGHEDTLFAYQAYLQNLNVLHINNPILHGDIDLNDVSNLILEFNLLYKTYRLQ